MLHAAASSRCRRRLSYFEYDLSSSRVESTRLGFFSRHPFLDIVRKHGVVHKTPVT